MDSLMAMPQLAAKLIAERKYSDVRIKDFLYFKYSSNSFAFLSGCTEICRNELGECIG